MLALLDVRLGEASLPARVETVILTSGFKTRVQRVLLCGAQPWIHTYVVGAVVSNASYHKFTRRHDAAIISGTSSTPRCYDQAKMLRLSQHARMTSER